MQLPSWLSSFHSTKRSSFGTFVDESTMLLMGIIGALILVLALLILFHENANATKGYRLRTLEQERSQLLLEHEVLTMKVAQQQSLTELQEDPRITKMVAVKDALYVDGDTSVAWNR